MWASAGVDVLMCAGVDTVVGLGRRIVKLLGGFFAQGGRGGSAGRARRGCLPVSGVLRSLGRGGVVVRSGMPRSMVLKGVVFRGGCRRTVGLKLRLLGGAPRSDNIRVGLVSTCFGLERRRPSCVGGSGCRTGRTVVCKRGAKCTRRELTGGLSGRGGCRLSLRLCGLVLGARKFRFDARFNVTDCYHR